MALRPFLAPPCRASGPGSAALQGVRSALLLVTGTVLAGMAQSQAQADTLASDAVARTDPFLPTPSVYLQVAKGAGSAEAFTVGVTLPWKGWQRMLGGGQLRGFWDIHASNWRADTGAGGHRNATALGLTPSFRLTPDAGRAHWFMEAGVGVVLLDRLYISQEKKFSTRLNFGTHLGAGRYFGVRRQHELALRVQHVSNARLKKPNPGENFVQLRYALHF